jgi:multicomponent Na+:H+ antiporter subunit E
MTRLARVVMLVLIWMALWSDVSVANLLSGLVVALGIVLLFNTWRAGDVVVRPIHAVRFALYFAYKLIQSSIVVARAVLSPKHRVHTGIVALPLHGCSDAVATLVADAISLTPGTLTLEVRRDPLTLYVHALDLRDVDQVRLEVRKLEVLAVKAFGSRAAVAALEVDGTVTWRGR